MKKSITLETEKIKSFTANELLVYVFIKACVYDEPSIDWLMLMTGFSRATVYRLLKSIKKKVIETLE